MERNCSLLRIVKKNCFSSNNSHEVTLFTWYLRNSKPRVKSPRIAFLFPFFSIPVYKGTSLRMSLPEKGPLLIIGSCCRGPFLARPSNVLGPKEIFKIKTCWIVAQCLAHKPSLIDRFIALFSNYWNFDLESKHNKQKTAFRARTVTGTFEKRAPCLRKGLVLRLFMSMVAWSL